MHQLILDEIVAVCERRRKDGDFPVDPQPNAEHMEDAILDLTARLEASEELNKKLQSLVDANQKLMDVQDRRENRQARLEAQEASEPVEFLADGTRYKVYGMHDSGAVTGLPESLIGRWVALVAADDGCHIRLAPQPTPNVKAAVAAAIRKAAEVAREHAVTKHGYDKHGYAEEILAVPHDDSALREICLMVASSVAENNQDWIMTNTALEERDQLEAIVARVLGEVK